MLKIENTEVMGWEAAIRGMRNPMNSWDRSDSGWDAHIPPIRLRNQIDLEQWAECYKTVQYGDECTYDIGPNDINLMARLSNAGTDHRKFMRMITVYVDITAPLYWWKEFDTYKVGTVANSCSTMHKITAKKFTLDDFSCEHLYAEDNIGSMYYSATAEEGFTSTDVLKVIIEALNNYRKIYLTTKDKKDWWQIIQLLPSSYNQRRTVMLNYEVLANIYKSRYDHKLDEWHILCNWITSLPYSELIAGKKN